MLQIEELEWRCHFAVNFSLLASSPVPTVLKPGQEAHVDYVFYNPSAENISSPVIYWRLIPYQFGRTNDLSDVTFNDPHAITIATHQYNGVIPAVTSNFVDAIDGKLPDTLPAGTYMSIIGAGDESTGSGIVTADIQVLTAKGAMLLSGTSKADQITLRASNRDVIPSLTFELANRTVSYPTADIESIKLTLAGGNDTVHIIGRVDELSIDAGAGNDSIYGGNGKEYILGSSGNDLLRGGADSDSLFGGGGADQLYGDAGSDSLDGGAGNDRLTGGADLDILRGQAGNDRLYTAGDKSIDLVFGDAGTDFIQGDAANDILFSVETKSLK